MMLPPVVGCLALVVLSLSTAVAINFSSNKIAYYRDRVKAMFYHAYDGYLKYAFPYDELMPITCKGMDTWGSFSLTLVDALDTLLIMGNRSEFIRATDLILKSIDVDANVNVSVFETNIRVIGGLLSAHMLSGEAGMLVEPGWPCSGPLLRLAERLANKLLPAFSTLTGMPFGTVNLRYGVHRQEIPITCTAGVGTFLLEFGTLSRLTGNPHFERVAMKALQELWRVRSKLSLVGNHINIQTGQWTATDAGIGAGVDSYFEYLVKGALMFGRPDLMRQFNEYKAAIDKYVKNDDWFFWVSMTRGHVTMPVFQSLEQFWPGLLSLTGQVDEAMRIVLNYHQILKQYGFSPEFYNIPNSEVVHKRSGYPLRPELVESIMYLYRSTRDPQLLEIGVDILEAIEHSAKTPCGYATVHDSKNHIIEDRMESFFLSETTKYLYLLFDPQNFIHNTGLHGRVVDTPNGQCVIETGGYIFNTEAHPFDPSIVYCCSQQRQRHIQLLEDYQTKHIDLYLMTADHHHQILDSLSSSGDVEDDRFEFEFSDLPAIELPFEMSSNSADAGENGSSAKDNGADDAIEYSVDDRFKETTTTSPPIDSNGDDVDQSEERLLMDENIVDKTANSSFSSTTSSPSDSGSSEQQTPKSVDGDQKMVDDDTYRNELKRSIGIAMNKSGLTGIKTIMDKLEGIDAQVLSNETVIEEAAANQRSTTVATQPQDWRLMSCSNRALDRMLSVVYGRYDWRHDEYRWNWFVLAQCQHEERPWEIDHYWRDWPSHRAQEDSYWHWLDEHGTVARVDDTSSMDVRRVAEYQFLLMSCPARPFHFRLMQTGQVIATSTELQKN